MIKRLFCILLTSVMVLGMFAVMPTEAFAASEMTVSDDCVELIKLFEGFASKPYYDYSQYTVGYGTRCPDEDLERYLRDGITREEAEALLREHLADVEDEVNWLIDKYSLTMDQGQFDALISFNFNLGGNWMWAEGTFRSAVINGATGNDFLFAICQWCNAGGQVVNGLIERRLKEANVYLNGEYSNTVRDDYCYVKYNANGGKSDVRVQGYDSDVPVAPIATATYEGYTFAGWYTASSGGSRVTVLDASTRNRTLYAQWIPGENADVPEPEPTQPTQPTEPDDPTEPSEPVEKVNVDVTVTGDVVNVRKGPGTGYAVVTTVKQGEKLTITETASGSGYEWGKYEKGWICLKYTDFDKVVSEKDEEEEEETPQEPEKPQTRTGTIINAEGGLRIRSKPSTSSTIAGYLSQGTKVEILEQVTAGGINWGRITKGWISMDYVQLDPIEGEEIPEEPPVTEPEEPEEPTQPTEPEPTEPPVTEPEETEPTEPEPPVTEPTEPTEPAEPEKPAGRMGTIINASGGLRIRKTTSTSSSIMGYLYSGDRVEILEQVTAGGIHWGRISKGWISMDYVKLDPEKEDDSSDEEPGETVIDTGVVINTNNLRIRSGPGTNNSVVGYLTMGTRVEIYEKRTNGNMVWGRISNGWISLDYIKLDQKPQDDNVKTVNTDSLRIRSGAGIGYSIVGYLSRGEKVTILETKTVGGTVWGRIDRGWISMDYVV